MRRPAARKSVQGKTKRCEVCLERVECPPGGHYNKENWWRPTVLHDVVFGHPPCLKTLKAKGSTNPDLRLRPQRLVCRICDRQLVPTDNYERWTGPGFSWLGHRECIQDAKAGEARRLDPVRRLLDRAPLLR